MMDAKDFHDYAMNSGEECGCKQCEMDFDENDPEFLEWERDQINAQMHTFDADTLSPEDAAVLAELSPEVRRVYVALRNKLAGYGTVPRGLFYKPEGYCPESKGVLRVVAYTKAETSHELVSRACREAAELIGSEHSLSYAKHLAGSRACSNSKEAVKDARRYVEQHVDPSITVFILAAVEDDFFNTLTSLAHVK